MTRDHAEVARTSSGADSLIDIRFVCDAGAVRTTYLEICASGRCPDVT